MKHFYPQKTKKQNQLCLSLLMILLHLGFISHAQTTFTESATTYGLNIDGNKDGGHAWADYDLDGDLDLLINRDRGLNSVLLRNQLMETGTASFLDVTVALTDGMTTEMERSAIFADFNNDGYPDFARNTGSGGLNTGIEIRLQHPATQIFGDGLGGTAPYIYDNSNIADGLNTEGMVSFDFDQDGDLDIAFDNHNFGIDLLINNGNGIFTHGTPKGPGYDQNDATTWPFGLAQDAIDGDYSAAADYDNDGLVDIISRKRGEVDFFRNIGGSFSTTSIDIDDADNNNKGGVVFYDFDNDGDFDLFWTENGTNQIHENRDGTYIALGNATGIPTQIMGDEIEGIACGDVDNDGDIDIFLAGRDGFLYINQINSAAGANTGSAMQFVQDTSNNFLNGPGNGEGCTFIDIDRDGDLDLYANISNGENQLYINNLSNANSDKYLYVDIIENRDLYNLTGTQQRYAVGATAVLLACDGTVISGLREVNGGNGHGTQDPQRIHFGIPLEANQEIIIEVYFPTGPDGRHVVRLPYIPNALGTGWERVAIITPDLVGPNNAPEAVDDAYEYNDTTITLTPLVNDSDLDGDPIHITNITQPDHGTAILNTDGTIAYTPEMGYCGTATLTYTIEDTPSCMVFAKTHTATIRLTANTTPLAEGDTYTIMENSSNNVMSVLDNDDFRCNGAQANIALAILTNPSAGIVAFNDNASPTNPLDDYLEYTPNTNFIGTDSFTYEITDANGQTASAEVQITVGVDPITSNTYDEEITIICGEDVPPIPDLVFMGGCGSYTVVFEEETVASGSSTDYMIVRTWTVTDICSNMEVFQQIIFVMQPEKGNITIELCVEEAAIDLRDYLPTGFDTSGTFEVVSGNVVLNDGTFDPLNLALDTYIISYNAESNSCIYEAEFTIIVNDSCVMEPCDENDISVSKAVTPNGDGVNDVLEILGGEACGYVYDIKVFNRWGNIVFESKDYQNNWGAFAPNNAAGSSGTLPTGTYYYILNVANSELAFLNGYFYVGTK